MKNLQTIINYRLDKFNGWWRTLPLKKQHGYMLRLFTAYFLLSVTVIGKVCYDTGGKKDDISVSHIENPVLQTRHPDFVAADSALLKLKKNIRYERQRK